MAYHCTVFTRSAVCGFSVGIAKLALIDNRYHIQAFNKGVALVGERRSEWHNDITCLFKQLRKFANVAKIYAVLKMVVVDISNNIPFGTVTQTVVRIKAAVGFSDNDLVAVIQSEFLVVMGINKTDSTLSLFKMVVKPIFLIAVAVKIVVTLIRVKAHKEGVVLRVHPHTIINTCAV